MSTHAPPRGEVVAAGDQEIHFLTYGEGPAVVLLHGSGPGASGYSNFKQNIDAIVSAGCRAIVMDMVGFGYSSKPVDRDYTTEFFASTVKAALEAIGVERAALFGNSLGGAICIRLALDHPDFVTSLIMMAPGGIEERETYFAMPGISKMVSSFVSGELDRDGLRKILEMLVFDSRNVSDELVDERYAILQNQPREVLSRMVIPSMEDSLQDIRCPIVGFWGQNDEFNPVSGAQKFLERCSDCRFTIVTDCGHWVMLEHQRMFNAQLHDFLTHSVKGS
ncbi:MAG: alpha/beta fold hydrolase [Gammaproteobacteria bacterium]|nr:alpha/beta fold hydrolase [Gammaproteobacteria bacterium]MDH3407761.1 alpha/beta fold hydrolase [Gammaproteobacteria bacterium]MDH3551120.1 alpha/beta fold hydrolase [Gammaproteobacteria bacterium]